MSRAFIFVFVGASWVERLRGNHAISAALVGITAAVVGVIANLAVFFALHTLFDETTNRSWGPVTVDLPDLTTLAPQCARHHPGGRVVPVPPEVVRAAHPGCLRGARRRRDPVVTGLRELPRSW